jgi:hypothetical protein
MPKRSSSESDNSIYNSEYSWNAGLHLKNSLLDHKGYIHENNDKEVNMTQFLKANHPESYQCRYDCQNNVMTPPANYDMISKSRDRGPKEVFLPRTSLETLMAFSRMNNLNGIHERSPSTESDMSNPNDNNKLWFKIKRRLSLNTK